VIDTLSRARARLVFHGALVLLIGLLSGLPTTVEAMNGSAREWHTAHEALIMIGVWIIAEAAILPVLVLDAPKLKALVWALVVVGYCFPAALILGGMLGTSPFSPGTTLLSLVAFVIVTVGILGSVVAAALTLMGARAALKAPA